MNVLLVRPKSLSIISNIDVINLEPLDLEYLYTVALEEKVSCEILDCLFEKRNLKDVLRAFKPDLVVICGYITQESLMLDYSKTVKEYNTSVKVMVGGVHAQINYERYYMDTIDYIVHSSSLEPFKRILRLGTTVEASALKDIDGICYRKDEQWTRNKSLPINPDDLPIPDRTHFNTNKHLYRYLGFSPCAIVKTAFSCPYQCNFCFCRKINGGIYTARSIELVVEEIEGIACDNIHIVDDTFLVNRERVNKFIALIKEKNIKYLDVGVSGGPYGARNGACLMIGGEDSIFKYLEPLFKDLSIDGGYKHFTGYGAGHFVKMVHNGIEYGMMQAIAEGFNLMRRSNYNLNLIDVADIYNNGSVIESRLIKWSLDGFKKYGIDLEEISGSIGSNGEGLWTVNAAEAMGEKVDNIKQSVDFRRESLSKPSYTGKIVQMIRNMFGGHSIDNK